MTTKVDDSPATLAIANEEFRRSEEQVRLLLDSTAEGIYGLDLEGNFTFCNAAAVAMLGYDSASELHGRNAHDLIRHTRADGETYPKDESRVFRAIAENRGSHGEDEILWRADGTNFSTESWSQLAGGIAHDFNNLLTVILGYTDLLAAKLDPASPELRDLDEIRKAGERAATLTRQLLAFSRSQVLERKVLDVNALTVHTENMLRRLIGEDVELVTVLDPALRRVFADAGQLEQVIMNLAVNARDAMPRGGKLTIETANVELDETYARLHGPVKPGSYVMIAVSDTGVGMNSDTLAHMFEPFFTTKERGKGTGLGLATVYGIVKQSGGYIWVYSEAGKGTTFKTYLPLADGVEAAEPVQAAEPAALAGSETVLLVEDEESVRALSRAILKSYGYTVLEAGSGKGGLDVARDYPLPIHLLLTDVVMPEMGGTDLASRLEALRPGVRVLYMSGYTDDAVFRHGLLEKGRVFLQKPFTPENLARKVREALAGLAKDAALPSS